MTKKTIIAGATTNPTRYAFLAAERLSQMNHPIVPVGIKKGEVFGEELLDIREYPPIADVDTITLYMGAANQKDYEDYFIGLEPKRIIFNPGAENPSLQRKAQAKGIETLNACTLVMLSASSY